MQKLSQIERQMALKIANLNFRTDRMDSKREILSDRRLGIQPSAEDLFLASMQAPDRGYLREGIALVRHHGLNKCQEIYN
jgi:hypothetical protein